MSFYISFLRIDLKRRIKKSITGILQINSTLINAGFENAFKTLAVSIATHIRIPHTITRTLNVQNIIIIIIICHQLDLDRPVSTLSNSPFKGLPSSLRPFGL